MGKIRVKTLGDETAEEQQKKELKKRKAEKKTREEAVKASPDVIATPDLIRGKQSQDSGQSQNDGEIAAPTARNDEEKKDIKKKPKKEKFAKATKPKRSRNYQTIAGLVDHNKTYTLTEALAILPKLQRAKFDETVELHINTLEQGVSGTVTLPHGTGKKIRVAIADDAVLSEVAKGKIDFDVLLAEPQMMPKLARVAKVLGPRGLMPNPKNGTVTTNPQEAAKKYEGGHMSFKTEAKSPIIHLIVGKVSFGDKKLAENIETLIQAIPATKIAKVTLKSTMSPGLKINFAV